MPETSAPHRFSVHRFIGVYHARGTLLGELAYVIGKQLGRTHCALCDITHGALRETREWQACRADLGVPFETLHLDERSPELVSCTDGRTPCVVAQTDHGLELWLGPDELDACAGSPHRLVEALVAESIRRDRTAAPG